MGRLAIALVPIAILSVYLAFFRPDPAPPVSPSVRDFDTKSDSYLDSTDRYAQPPHAEPVQPAPKPADNPAQSTPHPGASPPTGPATPQGG